MKQLERRQIVLIGILVALVVGFGVWKFVLSGGGDNATVEQPTTATSVATAQVDPNHQAATASPSAPAGSATTPSTTYVDTPFDAQAYRNPFVPAG